MLTLLISAVVTCVACYPVLRLLRRAGGLDVPNPRSSHAVPTPRGGGLALLAGIAAAALVALVAGPSWSTAAWVAVAGSTALALVGLADEWSASPRSHASSPKQPSASPPAPPLADGGSAARCGRYPGRGEHGQLHGRNQRHLCRPRRRVGSRRPRRLVVCRRGSLTVLGVLSLGCGLGFLPWNVPQARLFLGDVGSYLIGGLAGIGVLVATVALLTGGSSHGLAGARARVRAVPSLCA